MGASALPDIHAALIEHNPRVLAGVDTDLLIHELLVPADAQKGGGAALATGAVVVEHVPTALQDAVVDLAREVGFSARRIPQAPAPGKMLLIGPLARLTVAAHRLSGTGGGVSVGLALSHALEAAGRRDYILRLADTTLDLARRPYVMGILNVTPDSFSDGGKFLDADAAVSRGLDMAEQGADLIDVGGESTRPGAEPVPPEQQIKRVVPVVEKLAAQGASVSIDTASARVAQAALDAGAQVINDVTALAGDARMAALAAERDCPLILMHMLGEPRTMQHDPTYDDVMSDVARFLRERIARAVDAGVDEEQIVVDPGIGFGKTAAHNLELTRRLAEFRSLGRPILTGFSRKSTIGKVLNKSVEERIFGSLATAVASVLNGARIVRVHDVAATVDAVRMTQALMVEPSDDGL